MEKNMKKIIDENYSMFCNEEIVSLPSYRKASKRMSFSFRWDNKETVFAYASLKRCNLNSEGIGCRIIDFNNSDYLADEKFFDRIETIAKMWITKEKSKFDYLWFYTKDIDEEHAIKLIRNIKGFTYVEKHKAYIKRITP